ncbi:7838_t:CDS:1 [Racocetra fulgida]|uniref:7838_t:CDS:1 n=1 Tax=Racocetra fulgida TaxID=60492 RepID=A0A9N8WNQ0_9GLOM|nr:7838_t:CDS:1 [Racocetra fulgida]
MSPIPDLLEQYIIKTKEKINKSNHKVYYKAYINILGENERKQKFFPNKTDKIVTHLKKCVHFIQQTTPEERKKVFDLSNNEQIKQPNKNKKKSILSYMK